MENSMAQYRTRVFYTDEDNLPNAVTRLIQADNIEAALDRVLYEVHPFIREHWVKTQAVVYPNHFNGGSIVTTRERNRERY
jgi:hypothetical protein